MGTSERRITPRFNLDIPLSFHRTETLSGCEYRANAVDVSTRGVYFFTGVAMRVGEPVEVVLEIPKQVTGTNAIRRRFAGRVSHVESANTPPGLMGVGVESLYYERDLLAVEISADVNLAPRRSSVARR